MIRVNLVQHILHTRHKLGAHLGNTPASFFCQSLLETVASLQPLMRIPSWDMVRAPAPLLGHHPAELARSFAGSSGHGLEGPRLHVTKRKLGVQADGFADPQAGPPSLQDQQSGLAVGAA